MRIYSIEIYRGWNPTLCAFGSRWNSQYFYMNFGVLYLYNIRGAPMHIYQHPKPHYAGMESKHIPEHPLHQLRSCEIQRSICTGASQNHTRREIRSLCAILPSSSTIRDLNPAGILFLGQFRALHPCISLGFGLPPFQSQTGRLQHLTAAHSPRPCGLSHA